MQAVHLNFNFWASILEARNKNKKIFSLGLTLMIVVTVVNGIMLATGDPRATIDSLLLQLVGTGVLLAIILFANHRLSR